MRMNIFRFAKTDRISDRSKEIDFKTPAQDTAPLQIRLRDIP